MKAGTYRSYRTALKRVCTAIIGLVFLFVQISPRFYLLSSRPAFHSHIKMSRGQLSAGTLNCDHYAILSFDKRFAAQKQILFLTPRFESPFADCRPRLVILCPDKITHCLLLLNQGEELRGPPTT
jgi:hypothetical protein